MAQAAFLASLSIVAFAKPTGKVSPAQDRRNKLVAKLEEQLALAKDPGHAFTKRIKGGAQAARKVRPWWITLDGTGLALQCKYGATALELQKGKRAIALKSAADLEPTLQTLISACKAGELDAAISAVVGARKSNK